MPGSAFLHEREARAFDQRLLEASAVLAAQLLCPRLLTLPGSGSAWPGARVHVLADYAEDGEAEAPPQSPPSTPRRPRPPKFAAPRTGPRMKYERDYTLYEWEHSDGRCVALSRCAFVKVSGVNSGTVYDMALGKVRRGRGWRCLGPATGAQTHG